MDKYPSECPVQSYVAHQEIFGDPHQFLALYAKTVLVPSSMLSMPLYHQWRDVVQQELVCHSPVWQCVSCEFCAVLSRTAYHLAHSWGIPLPQEVLNLY